MYIKETNSQILKWNIDLNEKYSKYEIQHFMKTCSWADTEVCRI